MSRFHPSQNHAFNRQEREDDESHGGNHPIASFLLSIPVILTFWGANFAILYAISWSFVKAFQALGQINLVQFIVLVLAFKAIKAVTFMHKVGKNCHSSQRMNRCHPFHPSQRMNRCQPSPRIAFQQQGRREVNIRDKEEEVELSIDVPGVNANNLNVSVDDRVLTISGTRGDSSFSRYFQLDRAVDVENLTANVEDGVLTIRAPKRTEVSEPTEIPITAEKTQSENGEQTLQTEAEITVETVFEEDDKLKDFEEDAPAVATSAVDAEEVVMVEIPSKGVEA